MVLKTRTRGLVPYTNRYVKTVTSLRDSYLRKRISNYIVDHLVYIPHLSVLFKVSSYSLHHIETWVHLIISTLLLTYRKID